MSCRNAVDFAKALTGGHVTGYAGGSSRSGGASHCEIKPNSAQAWYKVSGEGTAAAQNRVPEHRRACADA
eukprot:3915119-Rhodomonas_salina.1